jgi:hypothetical protein
MSGEHECREQLWLALSGPESARLIESELTEGTGSMAPSTGRAARTYSNGRARGVTPTLAT